MATPRQLDYIESLLNQRQYTPKPGVTTESLMADARKLDTRGASAMIDMLKALPKRSPNGSASAQSRGSEPQAGMYRQPDGQIVRVYHGQQSGYMLLKNLVDTGVPYPKDENGVAAEGTIHQYEYVGRAAYNLDPEATLLPLAEAKEYGRMSGTCCRCARRLDVPESVEAGIGPVCAGKVGEWA